MAPSGVSGESEVGFLGFGLKVAVVVSVGGDSGGTASPWDLLLRG